MLEVTVKEVKRALGGAGSIFAIDQAEMVVQAATKMCDNHIGSLVVTDDDGGFVGIVTEHDILRRVVAQGRDPFNTLVSDIMSTEVLSCTLDTTLSELQKLMARYRIRHVPIIQDDQVDPSGMSGISGLITSRDIHAYELIVEAKSVYELAAQSDGCGGSCNHAECRSS